MPITKSAKKQMRQNIKRRLYNQKIKEGFKSSIKEFRKLVTDKKIKEAETLLNEIFSKLDKSAKEKVIRKNKASRLKSRLSKTLSKIKVKGEQTIPNNPPDSTGQADSKK